MAKHLLSGPTRRLLVLLPLALVALLALSGCSSGREYYEVAAGNWAFGRGDYQEANIDYFDALRSGRYPDYIAYDLGNVYHALGEGAAAGKEWAKAERSTDATLKEATLFNLGVLAYEEGRFRSAYDSFRRALVMDPADIEAKIDLELAYEKMRAEEATPSQVHNRREQVGVEKESGTVKRELELIHDREDERFRAAIGNAPVPPNVPDW